MCRSSPGESSSSCPSSETWVCPVLFDELQDTHYSRKKGKVLYKWKMCVVLLSDVCVCTHLLFTVYQCARGYSLEALFESSVNLLQSFGLWLSGAAASLVSWQVGLLWLGLRLLLHRRVPYEGVTSTHTQWNTHTHTQISECSRGPLVCRNLRLVFCAMMFKITFKHDVINNLFKEKKKGERKTISSTKQLLKTPKSLWI